MPQPPFNTCNDMDFSKKVNYQSDFDVLLNITDENGKALGYPDFDFMAKFESGSSYEVGQKGGVKRGVSDQDGKVKIVFNDHKLSPGTLKLVFSADVPDPSYPDGKKLHVVPVETDIDLTTGVSETSTGIVIDVKLPFSLPEQSETAEAAVGGGTDDQGD